MRSEHFNFARIIFTTRADWRGLERECPGGLFGVRERGRWEGEARAGRCEERGKSREGKCESDDGRIGGGLRFHLSHFKVK